MKKSRILLTGLTFSLVIEAAFGLTACGGHTHSIDAVAKKDATCTEAGYEAYYTCSDCDKIFSDAEGTIEISAPKLIPAQHTVAAVAKKNATCGETGYEAHYKCSVCNTLFSDAKGENTIEAATVIPKLTTHTVTVVSQKRATCTEDGYEEHFKCTVCNTLFEDEEATTAIEAPVAIPAAHRVTAVAQKDATCVEAGYEAHYKCTVCNTLFSDAEGATTIEEPTAIPATGVHEYEFNFTAETLPAPVAEGGTLAKTCVHCGAEQPTPYNYSKGIVTNTSISAPAKIEESGTYYSTYNDLGLNVSLKVTKAGTYTVTVLSTVKVVDKDLTMQQASIGDYAASSATKLFIRNGAWSTLSSTKALVEKWQPRIEIGEFGSNVQFTTISITIEEGDFDFSTDVYFNLCLKSNIASTEYNGALFAVEMPE